SLASRLAHLGPTRVVDEARRADANHAVATAGTPPATLQQDYGTRRFYSFRDPCRRSSRVVIASAWRNVRSYSRAATFPLIYALATSTICKFRMIRAGEAGMATEPPENGLP